MAQVARLPAYYPTGFTRFCHGSRIVAYEPGLFYASPTTEAVAFALRMARHLELQPPPRTPRPSPTPLTLTPRSSP